MLRLLLRFFALALLVGMVLSWLGRLGRTRVRRAAQDAASPPPEPMVRDRICNTFLPRSRALEVQAGGTPHYFCSESCRRKFLLEASTPAGRA